MDPLGKTMHIVVWEKTPARPDADGMLRFDASPAIPEAAFGNLTNLLECCSLWRIDTSKAVTRGLFDRKEKPGQLADRAKFVRGFFAIKGSMRNAIKRSHDIDLSFVEKYRSDERFMAAAAASAPKVTIAPLVGFKGTMTVMWMPILEPGQGPEIPIDFMLDLITSLDRWARQLAESQVLLDTGRITLTFGTAHLENGVVRPGRKTSGRLVGIGTYSTQGRSVADAAKESGLNARAYVIEEGRQTILACAQGYDVCKGTTTRVTISGPQPGIAEGFKPPIYDDPRNSLFG